MAPSGGKGLEPRSDGGLSETGMLEIGRLGCEPGAKKVREEREVTWELTLISGVVLLFKLGAQGGPGKPGAGGS